MPRPHWCAALVVASRLVTGNCDKRNRRPSFELQVFMGNYAPLKAPKIKAWLARRPRCTVALHADAELTARNDGLSAMSSRPIAITESMAARGIGGSRQPTQGFQERLAILRCLMISAAFSAEARFLCAASGHLITTRQRSVRIALGKVS
jgi:hypothetical protein